jgi:hypothetical protein
LSQVNFLWMNINPDYGEKHMVEAKQLAEDHRIPS